jgi:hypothetical protein
MSMQKLIESRMSSMKNERLRLAESWNPYIASVENYMQKQGKTLNEMDKMNIARCLENALLEGGVKSQSKLFETTDSSAISFLGIQLPVIAALLPSLVLNKLAVTQALDRRSGAVFYLDVLYGDNKGGVTSGSSMFSSVNGPNQTQTGREYASQRVYGEVLSTVSTYSFAGTLTYLPVIVGSVQITNGVETFTDNGAGHFTSSLSGTATDGNINYTTGVYNVTFAGLNIAGNPVTANYQYFYQESVNDGTAPFASGGVPQVNIAVNSSVITAEDFPLRANFTLGAAIDLEKAHGLNLEDELVKYLGGEVKFTMDHLGIDLIATASQTTAASPSVGTYGNTYAATSPGTYSATPSTGETWVWKKYQFIDFVEKANVNIINKTLRAVCNFLVVGSSTARLIRQLEPHFKPASGLDSLVPTGPYELGTLDGRLIIHDPLLSQTGIVFGFKGDNYLFSGFLFAPYIPLFSTPTLVTADLKAQKGFLASAGYKVVNAGMYTYGTISIT